MPHPVLIAGPTASGKSGLALDWAQKLGGAIINADSQQIYSGWRILSARPSDADHALAPHFLYGHVSMDADYSAGHWLRDVESVLAECAASGRCAIIVGGTGLYFRALTEGLAPIPPVSASVRAKGEAILSAQGLEAFACDLAARDPETAAKIDLENPRRVLRAWEVLEASGTGLATWQAQTPPPLVPLSSCVPVALRPPREWVYGRCEERFDQMITQGVLEEVRAVMGMGLGEASPSLMAVGAPELIEHLRGNSDLASAIESAKTETRRYAKRQMTWIRNQMGSWIHLDPTQAEDVEAVFANQLQLANT